MHGGGRDGRRRLLGFRGGVSRLFFFLFIAIDDGFDICIVGVGGCVVVTNTLICIVS